MSEYTTMRECLLRDINDLKHERDKARDWVFRLRKQRAIARNFGEQMERERNNLTDQRDFAIGQMKRLERERDHWKSESLEQAKLLAMSADREEKLRTALQRLADCDWVISLPDRMDAVRKIAREALQ
jgi:chromosome segregation ATPase